MAANIVVASWNIQNFGYGGYKGAGTKKKAGFRTIVNRVSKAGTAGKKAKATSPNLQWQQVVVAKTAMLHGDAQALDTIVRTIVDMQSPVVAVLEVAVNRSKNKAIKGVTVALPQAVTMEQEMTAWLNDKHVGTGSWRGELSRAACSWTTADAYGLVYDSGHVTLQPSPLPWTGTGTAPALGIVSDYAASMNLTPAGPGKTCFGATVRCPALALLRLVPGGKTFTLVPFHAPKPGAPELVDANLRVIDSAYLTGTAHAPGPVAVVMCGDFNVDFNNATGYAGVYRRLNTHSGYQTTYGNNSGAAPPQPPLAGTSLKTKVDASNNNYRANAYDNLFVKNVAGGVQFTAAALCFDVVRAMANQFITDNHYTSTELFDALSQALAMVNSGVPSPPGAKMGVSDHLPVYCNLTIT
jgi:hypothetical protein